MGKPGWAEESLTLTVQQRRLLIGLFGIVAIYMGVRLFIDRQTIADPQPPRGDHWNDLADRLDPNAADWTELAALPGLGEKRAKAIVAKREALRAIDPKSPPFRKPEDLYKVNGIGWAMTEQLKRYLRFPDVPVPSPGTPGEG